MANLTESQLQPSRSRSAARVKRHSVKTDMTPMVDLGFLLIAFFVMTTEMSRPSVTRLNMPKEGGSPSTLGESNALTLLIGADQVYYYLGDWEKAKEAGEIKATSFSVKDGIGRVVSVYFFALMQKSNKKDQGCRKMAKNEGGNRARRELASCLRDELKMPRARTTLRASPLGRVAVSSLIFLTPFF